MQKFLFHFVPIIIACFVLTPIGCSNPDSKYTKVEGVVTYNQQPVAEATVTFLPVSPGSDIESAAGRTDASGRFSLTSSGAVRGGQGILPGEYHVVVTKTRVPSDPDNEAFEQGTITYDELQERKSRRAPYQSQPTKNLLPEKYARPDQSNLRAKVEKGKNQTFNFDLTD